MDKYKREKLIEKIKKVVERVDKWELPLKIKTVEVFGSILWKEEAIGDADLFLTAKGESKIGQNWLKQIENNQKYLIELTNKVVR